MKARALAFLLLSTFPACGFQMRNVRDERFTAWKVRRVYIPPTSNRSYQVGLEADLRGEWSRRLATSGIVQVVASAADADAVLETAISSATRSGIAQSRTDQLPPTGLGNPDVAFNSMYSAQITAGATLRRTSGEMLWQNSLTRSQPFPSNTRLGYLGTTSALINDSETERAFREMIEQIVQDSYRQMADTF